ncbi:MAG: hypothetical protein RL741_463, partial [Actinomycetota bacterium]
MSHKEIDIKAELLAVNFEHLSWLPQRVFTVTASADNQIRGNHTTDCNEFVVLLNGKATFNLNADGIESEIHLNLRGNNLYINKGTFVRYILDTIGS